MKALGLVVSEKNIFENCLLKTYFLTPWPTYATNWNGLNNFGRESPRDHSCDIWSKSNEQFQRRCLSKKVDRRRMTDDGRRRTKASHNSSPSVHEMHVNMSKWNKKVYISIVSVENPTWERIGFAFDIRLIWSAHAQLHWICTMTLYFNLLIARQHPCDPTFSRQKQL